jgi:hypothetical protein
MEWFEHYPTNALLIQNQVTVKGDLPSSL